MFASLTVGVACLLSSASLAFGETLHPCESSTCGPEIYWANLAPTVDKVISTNSKCDDMPSVAHSGSAWMVVWSSQVWGKEGNGASCGSLFGIPYYYNNKLDNNGLKCTGTNPSTCKSKSPHPILVDLSRRFSHVFFCFVGNFISADIVFSVSTDNGGTWSAPANVSPTTETGTAWLNAPRVAAQGNKFVAVWSKSFEVYSSTSSDQGTTWSTPVQVNAGTSASGPGNGQYPPEADALYSSGYAAHAGGMGVEIKTGAAGEWMCTYQQQTSGGSYSVFASKSTDNGANEYVFSIIGFKPYVSCLGISWSAQVQLTALGTSRSDAWPRLAWSAADGWMAVWESKESKNLGETSSDIYFSTSADGLLFFYVPLHSGSV